MLLVTLSIVFYCYWHVLIPKQDASYLYKYGYGIKWLISKLPGKACMSDGRNLCSTIYAK